MDKQYKRSNLKWGHKVLLLYALFIFWNVSQIFCSFQFVLRFWFERCLSKVSVINALNRTKMTLEFWNLPSLKISQKLSDLKLRVFSSTFSVLFTAVIDFLSLYVEYIGKCWNSTVSLRLHWRVRVRSVTVTLYLYIIQSGEWLIQPYRLVLNNIIIFI